MRLVRLKVEHFAALRYVRLEFGPGLNVLYGPNDLGKSTLANALRAVLLVPSTSTAASPWVEWQSDQAPQVELDFQTEERRFWRVKKSFGSGARGTALLESSRDGVNYSTVVHGRGVDGELRGILRWGIPSPGGKSAPKGEPETFLTTALLARQEGVDAIFAKGLAGDHDESGREQLSEALQTLGQDPLLKSALETAQAKVDEVFTPRGGKKKGQGSPLVVQAEKIKEAAQEVNELALQAEQTDALKEKLQELHEGRLRLHTAVEEARARLGGVELARRRDAAAAKLEAMDAQLAAVAEAEKQERELERVLAEKSARVEKGSTALERAKNDRDEAAEAARVASGGDADARRQLEQQKLEKRQVEVRADREDVRRRAERARAAVQHAAEVRQAEEALEEGRQKRDAVQADQDDAAAELERWHRLETYLRLQELDGERRNLVAKAERAEGLRRGAAEKREAAGSSQDVDRWPSAEEMDELRRLREEYRVAKARLEVGLSVSVKPKKRLDVRLQVDGGETREETLSLPVQLEAERRLRLEIEDLVEVQVRGGSQELREEVDALAERFEAKAGPWLAKTGVATVEELEAASRGAEAELRRAADLEQEAASLLAQAEALDGDADRLAELERRVAEARERLGDEDLDAFAVRARELGLAGPGDVKERQAAASRRREELTRAVQELRVELAGRESRLVTAKKELAAASEVLAVSPEEALASAEAALAKLDLEAAELTEKLGALQVSAAPAAETEARLAEVARTVAAAEAEKAAADAERDAVQQQLARLRGELELRREQASKLDREAQAKELGTIEGEMERAESSAGDVEGARSDLEAAEAALRELEAEIREAEGALKQVGGDVVRERLERAEEGLEQHREREAELELDYAAWRLLAETLREAESEEASHLGRALVDPVSEGFRKLTRGRYGGLRLGPGLETQGVRGPGGTYGVEALSVGTRHHLSTLFRLAVAEQLGTTVVLDDQLVQSDIQTMAFFRDLLKEKAGSFQIVVLTCRPEEYLEPGEMPGRGDKAERDTAEGIVRAVDLERLVARSGRPAG